MSNVISHITFIVQDLEKSAAFLRTVFEAKEVYSSDGHNFSLSHEKFFLVKNLWIVLMQGNSTERSYNHIAFKISDDEFDAYTQRVQRSGAEIKQERPRVDGEGRSLYFYDYDNHLFEIHTGTLEERLKSYAAYQKENAL